MELKVDPERIGIGETGVFIRAMKDDKWGSYDIAELDKQSLRTLLEAKPQSWSIDLVGIILGHGHLK
jgi:hypothetical protein